MPEKDLLLSQVQRGLNGYNAISRVLRKQANYDVVIAHETFCSGLAALYYVNQISATPLKILDIVEYPVYSQRSSTNIRRAGLQNPYADLLTYDFAVNIANKFDHCISTSAGQAATYVRNGCISKIDLVMNCREDTDIPDSHTDTLAKMYGFVKSDILLVYPNRAYEHCGLESALQALALLDARFKLVVLGEVVEEIAGKIDELVVALGLQDRFFITGMLDPSLILPILSEADIALILLEPIVDNHRYSLPNRLFDAMATLTPIVAYANTEIGDFVQENRIGVVVEDFTDTRTLAIAIEQAVVRNIFFKNRLKELTIDYTWTTQFNKIFDLMKNYNPSKSRVLLVAMKDIRRNDRIRRIARSLHELNFHVDVVTRWMPLSSMIVEGVKYHCTTR